MDGITLSVQCTCGSTDFSFPNDPPRDDDVVICNGCGDKNTVATIRRAALAQGQKLYADAIKKALNL
jgi:hypothetical protein